MLIKGVGIHLQKFLHRYRDIPSMSYDVVQRSLRRSVELCFTERRKGSGKRLGRGSGKSV